MNFGFNRGAELVSPKIKLNGTGKLIRHFKVTDMSAFPKKEISSMITEAIRLSEENNPALMDIAARGSSIVMSISEKKIRPTR